jgi:hypothetical protein
MDITVLDGFKMIPSKNGQALLIESDRLNEYLNYAVEKKILSIALMEYHGYKLPEIGFLRDYNFFTEIWVRNYLNYIDISGVHYLDNAQYLILSNEQQEVDFSSFPNLRAASVDWNSKLFNLDACKHLSELVLRKYKPKAGNLTGLISLQSLSQLKITQSNITSLSGIEHLSALTQFEAYYLSKLESLKDIDLVKRTLRTLILGNCKKLRGHENSLAQLTQLDKLILSNCGELSSVQFVNAMPSLKFFSFVNTTVQDGNLSPLQDKKFEYVGFDDKRHYSHKMKEITPSFHWKVSNK